MVIASIYPLISSCWIVTLWSALSAETTLPLTSYRWAAFEASGDLDAGPEPQAETIRPKINKEQSRNLLFITSVFSQFSGASLVFTINAREMSVSEASFYINRSELSARRHAKLHAAPFDLVSDQTRRPDAERDQIANRREPEISRQRSVFQAVHADDEKRQESSEDCHGQQPQR